MYWFVQLCQIDFAIFWCFKSKLNPKVKRNNANIALLFSTTISQGLICIPYIKWRIYEDMTATYFTKI